MKKIIIFSSLFIISNATAQTCIPKPDCADMGYTKSSCKGPYLKCPFDTSKLACLVPVTGCNVGYIYYSDGTCDSIVYSTKTPIGVIVKANELVMSLDIKYTSYWASSTKTDVGDVINYTSADVKTDYNGKNNTFAIVEAYPNDTKYENVAKYCNSYLTEGTSVGDWYLPAAGEVYEYIYGIYTTLSSSFSVLEKSLPMDNFWSSSERDATNAWYVNVSSGSMSTGAKNNYNYTNNNIVVSCFLAL